MQECTLGWRYCGVFSYTVMALITASSKHNHWLVGAANAWLDWLWPSRRHCLEVSSSLDRNQAIGYRADCWPDRYVHQCLMWKNSVGHLYIHSKKHKRMQLSQTVILFSKLNTTSIIKNNNFRGDTTDISSTTKTMQPERIRRRLSLVAGRQVWYRVLWVLSVLRKATYNEYGLWRL